MKSCTAQRVMGEVGTGIHSRAVRVPSTKQERSGSGPAPVTPWKLHF